MEQSGRNQRQPVASRPTPRTAQASHFATVGSPRQRSNDRLKGANIGVAVVEQEVGRIRGMTFSDLRGPSRRAMAGCSAGSDQARFVGVDDRLDAIAEVELLQDPGDMGLRGCLADHELAADLGVGASADE